MLSKFDLKTGIELDEFEQDYLRFIDTIRTLGFIKSAGPIGRRIKDTPMDTAGDDEPEFYSIMSFKDRERLDAAYSYLLDPALPDKDKATHHKIHKAVTNSVFICWQDTI
jgi:hypothetical protein